MHNDATDGTITNMSITTRNHVAVYRVGRPSGDSEGWISEPKANISSR